MMTSDKGAALFADCEGLMSELSAADESVLTGGGSKSSRSSRSGSSSGGGKGGGKFNFVFVPVFVPFFPKGGYGGGRSHGKGGYRYWC